MTRDTRCRRSSRSTGRLRQPPSTSIRPISTTGSGGRWTRAIWGAFATPSCRSTEGRYIAYLDADDLFSENWLVKGLDHLEAALERGQRTIAHPEVIATFDGAVGIHQNVDQRSPLFTPYFLYMRNAYDSLCLTPREAHLTVPYVHRDIARGLSWQDWQFAIETMSRGWEHVVVPDTVIFKRRRDFSLMVESAGRKSLLRSLPEMAIDLVRNLPHPGSD